VQQQPLLLAQGLERAFKGAAGTKLLQAAGSTAELLRAHTVAATVNMQVAGGRELSASAAAKAAAQETAAFSMLLSGMLCASKAAADFSHSLDTHGLCGDSMLLASKLVIIVLHQDKVSIEGHIQLLEIEKAAIKDAGSQPTAGKPLLASIQKSAVLVDTALHAYASILLAWQAAAVPDGPTRVRLRSSSSSRALQADLKKESSVARTSADTAVLGNRPALIADLLKRLDESLQHLYRSSSSMPRNATALAKMQQQLQDINAQLADVSSTHAPAAAAAVAAAATPAAVLAAAAAAYDRQLLQQLQQYVASVAALLPAAVLGACGNIACINTAPDMQLSQCSSCKACYFCGSECQVCGQTWFIAGHVACTCCVATFCVWSI
jgi:hypothetical protein